MRKRFKTIEDLKASAAVFWVAKILRWSNSCLVTKGACAISKPIWTKWVSNHRVHDTKNRTSEKFKGDRLCSWKAWVRCKVIPCVGENGKEVHSFSKRCQGPTWLCTVQLVESSFEIFPKKREIFIEHRSTSIFHTNSNFEQSRRATPEFVNKVNSSNATQADST